MRQVARAEVSGVLLDICTYQNEADPIAAPPIAMKPITGANYRPYVCNHDAKKPVTGKPTGITANQKLRLSRSFVMQEA